VTPELAVAILFAMVACLVVLMVCHWLLARRRVRREIRRRGGTVRRISWSAFSPHGRISSPWFFEVSYIDPSGNWHLAHCLALLVSLVWHDDRVIGHGGGTDDQVSRMSS